MAAVSARRMRGTERNRHSARDGRGSPRVPASSKPPSGPIEQSGGDRGGAAKAFARAVRRRVSSAKNSMTAQCGQSLQQRIELHRRTKIQAGLVRPHCSAASTICAVKRSGFSLSTTATRRQHRHDACATPSSHAFSAITRSIRPFLIGAQQSQKSGTDSDSRVWFAQRIPASRPRLRMPRCTARPIRHRPAVEQQDDIVAGFHTHHARSGNAPALPSTGTAAPAPRSAST
jgi:hypothetical protein